MFSTQQQAVLVRIENFLFVHSKACGSTIPIFMDFPQYLITTKNIKKKPFTNYLHQGQIHRLELVAMMDTGWNQASITVWGASIALRYFFCELQKAEKYPIGWSL